MSWIYIHLKWCTIRAVTVVQSWWTALLSVMEYREMERSWSEEYRGVAALQETLGWNSRETHFSMLFVAFESSSSVQVQRTELLFFWSSRGGLPVLQTSSTRTFHHHCIQQCHWNLIFWKLKTEYVPKKVLSLYIPNNFAQIFTHGLFYPISQSHGSL